ncbi:MAG TPA: sulfite exporter TauE/SafE family protein [Terriglobia bacterium]|nr:sulfite exporter TauE/SafE family protein [Terriglobia bacterium]
MSSHPVDMVAIGFIIGTIGTLIGAGGGFLLVPILLLLDPHMAPAVVTGISLAVVFFNAASGTIAYARMGRIVYRAGIAFSLAALPGAVIGAYTISYIPRSVFNGIFGCLMIAAAVYLMTASESQTEEKQLGNYNLGLGAAISVVVGFLSSVLGIGGGIIHVPALTRVLDFPVHMATATSHFVLSITALVATIIHLMNGTLTGQFGTILWISIGAIFGAQAGAMLSTQMKGSWILRLLAAGLGLIGIRILLPLF